MTQSLVNDSARGSFFDCPDVLETVPGRGHRTSIQSIVGQSGPASAQSMAKSSTVSAVPGRAASQDCQQSRASSRTGPASTKTCLPGLPGRMTRWSASRKSSIRRCLANPAEQRPAANAGMGCRRAERSRICRFVWIDIRSCFPNRRCQAEPLIPINAGIFGSAHLPRTFIRASASDAKPNSDYLLSVAITWYVIIFTRASASSMESAPP